MRESQTDGTAGGGWLRSSEEIRANEGWRQYGGENSDEWVHEVAQPITESKVP
ncbi:hypothetical protein [Virgibacillus ihumii]|uniref:hypothetical protein n=1 Tax=Virgibacillus ihumii TaxID=2686091 RepID=UPI00157BFE6E|nr:hypothetical protein [Virgibacillus ihumii]